MSKASYNIQKHKKQGRGTQYLVNWKGYEDEHDQWIVESVLFHVKEAIEDYCTRCSSQNL